MSSAFRVGLACSLVSILPCPAPASAQPAAAVQRVHVNVNVTDGGARVAVVARFRLEIPPGQDTLRLTAIPFFGLRPASLSGMLNGAAIAVGGGFDRTAAGAHILLRDVTGAAELELHYSVPDAALLRNDGGLDLRVPLVLPVATAAGSGDDFFQVELSAPAAYTVVESFPSVAAAPGAPPEAMHAMRLPAAPSLLRWRLASGPARVTFARTVDIALAAILAVLGLLGIRALRRPTRDG